MYVTNFWNGVYIERKLVNVRWCLSFLWQTLECLKVFDARPVVKRNGLEKSAHCPRLWWQHPASTPHSLALLSRQCVQLRLEVCGQSTTNIGKQAFEDSELFAKQLNFLL